MSEQPEKTYRPWEPECYRHEAQSPAAKLPAGDLVFFLLDTVRSKACCFYAPYETAMRGAPPCDPAMMVCLLLSASCVGVFPELENRVGLRTQSRLLAIVGRNVQTSGPSAMFARCIWRRSKTCVQVVRRAGEAGWRKLGNVSTDGTTIQGMRRGTRR